MSLLAEYRDARRGEEIAPDLERVHPEALVGAAAPVLKALAAERGLARGR